MSQSAHSAPSEVAAPRFPVALTPCSNYERQEVEAAVRRSMLACGLLPPSGPGTLSPGDRVLVKPNLLRAHALSCTHPEVVRAVCLCLQEHGLRVLVGDSPGFGTARGVAESVGLAEALRPLGLDIHALSDAQRVRLSAAAGGGHWGVARLAMECDHIVSVPRVKAHSQMRLTLAVKNLFGCVCGLRKAVAHAVQGRTLEMFTAALLDLWAQLPPTSAVADGVTAMHVTGPSGGQPFALGCVGAASSAMALDTALGTILGMDPALVPLWDAARMRGLPQSYARNLDYVLSMPDAFAAKGFVTPELTDVSFQPHRLCMSLCRRIWSTRRGSE